MFCIKYMKSTIVSQIKKYISYEKRNEETTI